MNKLFFAILYSFINIIACFILLKSAEFYSLFGIMYYKFETIFLSLVILSSTVIMAFIPIFKEMIQNHKDLIAEHKDVKKPEWESENGCVYSTDEDTDIIVCYLDRETGGYMSMPPETADKITEILNNQ